MEAQQCLGGNGYINGTFATTAAFYLGLDVGVC